MARHLNTIPGRLLLMLLLIHAVLMPPLFYVISNTVEGTTKDIFVDDVRNFAQIFVDRIERLEPDATEQRIVELLDSAILSGQGSYAAIDIGGRIVANKNRIFRFNIQFAQN